MAYPRLWTFEHQGTPMLEKEKSLQTEPTQLYQKYGMNMYSHITTLKGREWFVIDCHTAQYSLGSPEWNLVVMQHTFLAMAFTWVVGLLNLGFTWAQGRIFPIVTKIANLLFSKVRWAPYFHQYDLLSAVFVPSTGLEDVITHIEALTTFPQHSLIIGSKGCPY